MLGPILRGERISLEPARMEDAALRCSWLADLELSHFWTSPTVPSLKQEEEAFDRWARDDASVHWRLVVDGETAGSVFLHSIDWINRQGQQGIVIGRRADWGKGYGSEAVKLRTAYAFEELGLERLETSSLESNIGMHRALERSGFVRAGLRRRALYVQGEWRNEVMFELLRSEWQGRG
jgi:RimJ/RimL family protein N-acetyltransferase